MEKLDALTKQWNELTAEVLTGFAEWRQQHPRAKLREIEEALDSRWAAARARMVAEAAMISAAQNWSAHPDATPIGCPQCGAAVESRGQHGRQLTTQRDQVITLERSYAVCSACQTGFFPPR